MPRRNSRRCPICGKTVDVRGYALHLKNAHDLTKEERAEVMAISDRPSVHDVALDLVDRLLELQVRKEQLRRLFDEAQLPPTAKELALLDVSNEQARREAQLWEINQDHWTGQAVDAALPTAASHVQEVENLLARIRKAHGGQIRGQE